MTLSGSSDENQLKRKSVEGEYELLEQNAKKIIRSASDPEGSTVTTSTGESEGTAVLAQPVLPAQEEIMSVSNTSSDGVNVDKGENLSQSRQQAEGSSSVDNEGHLSDSTDDDKFEESFEFVTADDPTVDEGNSQIVTQQCSNATETPLQPSLGRGTHTSEVVEDIAENQHETEQAEEALKNLAIGSPRKLTSQQLMKLLVSHRHLKETLRK